MPDEIKMRQNYHITELIPRPSLRPEKIKPKPLPTRAKLLPAAPIEKPHLIVTREIRPPKIQAPPPQEIEPPKVAMNNFAPAVIKPIVGGARPVLVHTGAFEGQLGDSHGECAGTESSDWRLRRSQRIQGRRQANAHLVAAARLLRSADGPRTRQRSGRRQRY